METSNPASGFPAGRPRIVPVIDLMGGRVVRAVGGRRSEYQPVRSVLTDSTEPGEVARALVAATGAECIYIADLDAIVHQRPDPAGVRAVAATGAIVICDGGYRTVADVAPSDAMVGRFVVATETTTPDAFRRFPVERTVLSIDLFEGRVVGGAAWGHDAVGVTNRAAELGVRRVIFLDLARVGTGTGAGTEGLIVACRRTHPHIGIIAGGGVRSWDDVQRLTDAGADAVLVASALHDGTMGNKP